MKGKFRIKRLAVLVTMILSVNMFAACGDSAEPEISITLDGKEIAFEETLQTCIDAGLITTNVQGEPEENTLVYGAMEVRYDSIHLGTSSTPNRSEVTVMLYNPTSSSATAYGSKVMSLFYYLTSDNADQAPVLFNGVDFWGMTQDDALAKLQELGFEFGTDSLDEYHFIVFSGKDSVTVTMEFAKGSEFENVESTNPQKAVVDFDSETYYVSKLEASISGKLNIDFSGS